ncbi:MAG: hypothetical protein LBH41_00740 [Rickettsiales bacterium]|nr:hypothetical protein [Rickettsiales bacterium]
MAAEQKSEKDKAELWRDRLVDLKSLLGNWESSAEAADNALKKNIPLNQSEAPNGKLSLGNSKETDQNANSSIIKAIKNQGKAA